MLQYIGGSVRFSNLEFNVQIFLFVLLYMLLFDEFECD